MNERMSGWIGLGLSGVAFVENSGSYNHVYLTQWEDGRYAGHQGENDK